MLRAMRWNNPFQPPVLPQSVTRGFSQRFYTKLSVPPMPPWKKYARIILPHIGLILLSFSYIIGGAFVFYHLERPNELAVRQEALQEIEDYKKAMLDHLWILINDNTSSQEEVEAIALGHVDTVSRMLFDAFDTDYITDIHLRDPANQVDYSWTMSSSIFFTTTLLTTIGYGNLVPGTVQGRLFCIFYALFGVPLILITVADIGKFLSENIVWLYRTYTKIKKTIKQKRENNNLSMDEDRQMKDQLEQVGIMEPYIPTTMILSILLGYMAIGAILLASWERWGFFEGFYFSFITMTTVGFGDIVPINQRFFMFDLCYIIIGLAITTMCIDLVGIQYIRKIHYFGRAIQDARYALVNVGGRMVHVPDLMRYASVLHQKYGRRKDQDIIAKGAYAPKELPIIRYIDYSTLTSLESLSSFLSSIVGKSREPSNV
uniref:Potassium channel domain-containing protein n=2 Tax=Acrobeloides nanus TaxID=290746 RepID=A0A914BVB1_9BILA